MNWQMVAEQNGITEPVNGSWLQAICESLGITEPVNGSWIQALAQYGPFPTGGGGGIENTITDVSHSFGDLCEGCGSKGEDLLELFIQFNTNIDPESEEAVGKAVSIGNWPVFLSDSNVGKVNTQYTDTNVLPLRFTSTGANSMSFTMIASQVVGSVFRLNIIDQTAEPPLVSETILHTITFP